MVKKELLAELKTA
jgi:hypothetical protein